MKSRNIVLVTLFTLLTTATLHAQKLTSGYLFPAGGQVGTTVEIMAGGLNINQAKKVIFNHPGIKGEIVPFVESAAERRRRRRLSDQSSPQLADKVKIRITIDSNVPCGLYDLRLQSPRGLSNKLPFEVSSSPNILENRRSTRTKPNIVESLPAVLCGYVTPGGIDFFEFEGKKGETIVASVTARMLVPYIADAVPGWFQPVIKIMDARGKEVAYSDDYNHYVDPVITTTLPEDGKYTLMIHDAIYRGREDFNYRIHLGVIPFVKGRYPAYGVAGKRTTQQLDGVNLGTNKSSVKVNKEGYHQVTFTNKEATSNSVPFYALPKGTRLLHSPKGKPLLTFDNAISDSLTKDEKIKRYYIETKSKEPLVIELIGRRNGSRIDAVMRLRDRFNRVVATVDDTEDPIQGLVTFHADPVLKYMPQRSEEMILEVEDLHRGHGKDYHYLLRRHRQMPAFNAFVSPAYISVASGGTSSFSVEVKGRLRRPAHLIIKGLPDGYTTSCVQMHNSRRWDVSITTPKGAAPGRVPIELKVEYPERGKRAQAPVLPVDNMMQAFYYTHYIPAAEWALDITEPSPYRMSLDIDLNKEVPVSFTEDTIPIKVYIDKNADFTEPVELLLSKKNRAFSLEPISIAPNETEKTIYLKVNQQIMERYKNRKNSPTWQNSIVGTVKGEIVRRGRRQFQNAKYSEMTPIFMLKLQK